MLQSALFSRLPASTQPQGLQPPASPGKTISVHIHFLVTSFLYLAEEIPSGLPGIPHT